MSTVIVNEPRDYLLIVLYAHSSLVSYNSNTGPFSGWRGGAIKTEPGTSVAVSNSKFLGNSAAGGGAIFHHGDTLSVRGSSFYDNYAKVSIVGGCYFERDVEAAVSHMTCPLFFSSMCGV